MSDSTIIKKIVTQAIDLHVHIGPELIPRKFSSVRDLTKAEGGKIAGMALKNHFYPTQPFISELGFNGQKLTLIGGLVLNNFQGGLNPEAIYANSVLSSLPTIVWLPTINAKQFLDESEFEIAPEWVQRNDFSARKARSIKPVLIDRKIEAVLQAIKANNAILATGHVSWQEATLVMKKAIKLGLKRLIVTHPIYDRIKFPIKEQIELAKSGVKMEHCYSMFSIDNIPMAKIADQVQTVGAENCIISSDVGQTFSPPPSEALRIFAILLRKEGISINELEMMMVTNPKNLIGL